MGPGHDQNVVTLYYRYKYMTALPSIPMNIILKFQTFLPWLLRALEYYYMRFLIHIFFQIIFRNGENDQWTNCKVDESVCVYSIFSIRLMNYLTLSLQM